MAREIGNLYYTIGIKGEKDATASLKRVQDAIAKNQKISSVSGISMAKPPEGVSASAVKDAKDIAAREAKKLGFELGSIVREVRAITKAELASLAAKGQTAVRGAFSPSQKTIAVNRTATERTIKHELLHAIDAAIGGGKLASTIQGHLHNKLAKAFAPTRFKEIIESESFAKMDQKRKNAYLKYSMLPQELFVNLMERQSDEFKRAVFGTSGYSLAKIRKTGASLPIKQVVQQQLLASSQPDYQDGFAQIARSIAAGANYSQINKGAISPAQAFMSGGKGLGFGSTGSGLFGTGFMGMPVPLSSAIGSGKYQMPGMGSAFGQPTLVTPPPVPLPTPWLYRINSMMTEESHQQRYENAMHASNRAREISGQVLGYGIHGRMSDANAEIEAALRDQASASQNGDVAAMEAANRRLNTAQNNLLDTEERRLFVAGQHRDIIRDVNTFLGTTVTLESKIAAAEEAAVNFARHRDQDMTPEQENTLRERVRQGIVSRSAHGGTKAADYENKLADITSRRREQGQYYRSTVTRDSNNNRVYGDAVAREYRDNLVKAERIARRQVEREQRMAEIRNEHGGEAPGFGRQGYLEYNRLSRAQRRDDRSMMKYNDMLNNTSYANNRWNTQIMELGYGIQDFTQVLAGGGGLSAALRGASNNFSQFFAVSGGKNAALWATGIGVGALAVGTALDAISKQSKEAADRIEEFVTSAEGISRINLKTLSEIHGGQFNPLNPSIGYSGSQTAYKAERSRQGLMAADAEFMAQDAKRGMFSSLGESITSTMPKAIQWLGDAIIYGQDYAERESQRRGKYNDISENRGSVNAFIDKLSGKDISTFNERYGTTSEASAIKNRSLEEGLQYLKTSGVDEKVTSQLGSMLTDKIESDAEKRFSDYSEKYNADRYSRMTKLMGGMAGTGGAVGYGAVEQSRSLKAEMDASDARLNYLNQELNRAISGEITMSPEAMSQNIDDTKKLEARRKLIDERYQSMQGAVGQISSSNQISSTFDSMADAINSYNKMIAEAKNLDANANVDFENAILGSKLSEMASGFSPQMLVGESLSDFSQRVQDQMVPIFEIFDDHTARTGEKLDHLKDRIKMLGDLAVDVAEAMETYDRSIAGTAGLTERDADYKKDMAAIEQERETRYAENKKKYGTSDPVLHMALNAAVDDDLNRKIKRREFQMIKDQNDDKMFFGSKIASMVGGREGRKLQAEMEYDQMLASIEQSKMDPAMKAEKQQEAKDIRSAMMEDIDRKNVSFTDVGSQWKTIQNSLQGEPNKKILNHWNKYMGLVTGEGIRVKLSVGT